MDNWRSGHDHVFGQDLTSAGERRTLIVAAITTVTMVIEIAAGLAGRSQRGGQAFPPRA